MEIYKKISSIDFRENINGYIDLLVLTYYISQYDYNNRDKYLKILDEEIISLLKSLNKYEYRIIGCEGSLLEILYLIDSFDNSNSYQNLKLQMFDCIAYYLDIYLKTVPPLYTPAFYDLISGITSLGNYLIINSTQNKNFIKNEIMLQLISDKFISMFNTKEKGLAALDNFCVHIESEDSSVPYKSLDLGLSHGLLGPLVFMSKLYRKNEDKKLLEAIECGLAVYEQYRSIEDDIPNFPTSISYYTNKIVVTRKERMSWCYGNIGVLRGIHLINENLNKSNKELIKYIRKISALDSEEWRLICPTFCHGKSGMLTILNEFNREHPHSNLVEGINVLTKEIWECYSSKYIYGFPKKERDYFSDTLLTLENDISVIGGIGSILIAYIRTMVPIENDFLSSMLLVN
jgi:Lanthionine synthetase C-like protein.